MPFADCITVIGSPPLARGTGRHVGGMAAGGRITPACAGNSDIYRFGPGDTEDHPRLRGEQCFVPHLPARTQGSPPLARGTDF